MQGGKVRLKEKLLLAIDSGYDVPLEWSFFHHISHGLCSYLCLAQLSYGIQSELDAQMELSV